MMPDAYKTGFKMFCGRSFFVNKNVLIPRIETEGLIDLVLCHPELGSGSFLRIVDVGTGSGCIGITLKLEILNSDVTLIDISDKALEVAKINANRLNADVGIRKSDLLDQNYDLVVANLPYVPHKRIRYLTPDVKDWEPKIALDGGKKGLELIYKLLDQCIAFKIKHVLLEIDDTHILANFAKYKKIFKIKLLKDLYMRNRFLVLDAETSSA